MCTPTMGITPLVIVSRRNHQFAPFIPNRGLSNLIETNKNVLLVPPYWRKCESLPPICPRANRRIFLDSSFCVRLYPISLRPHICIPRIKCFIEPTGSPGQDNLPNRLFSSISIDVAVVFRPPEPLHFDQALLGASNGIYRHGSRSH